MMVQKVINTIITLVFLTGYKGKILGFTYLLH